MFYGLAHRETDFYADNMHKFVALSPCTVCPEAGPESYWKEVLYSLPSIGVYDVYGPTCKANHDRICSELGEKACKYTYSPGS